MKFTFTFPVDGQPLLITMTGKVDGDAIAGKADFGGFAEGDWSAKRATAGRRGGSHRHARDDHRRPPPRRPRPPPTTTTTTAGGFGGKWDVDA